MTCSDGRSPPQVPRNWDRPSKRVEPRGARTPRGSCPRACEEANMDATESSTATPRSAPWTKTLPVDGFTDAWLTKECARRNARRRDIGDRRSGLAVRIEPSGVATFYTLQRQPDGSRKKYTLGSWPQVSIEEARRRVERIRGTPHVDGDLNGMSPLGD